MKIDMTAALKAVNGDDLMGDDGAPVPLRTVVQNALLGTARGDDALDGPAKLALWDMAKAAQGDEAEYSAEEVALIKSRIAKIYGAAIVGPAFSIIDPRS